MQGIPDSHLAQLHLGEHKVSTTIGDKRGQELEGPVDVVKQVSQKPLEEMGVATWGLYYIECRACRGVRWLPWVPAAGSALGKRYLTSWVLKARGSTMVEAWCVTEDAGDHTCSSNSRVDKPRVLNSSCVQVSENHSKSECQHHSSSPISPYPMKAILCLSALWDQHSPACFPGAAAQLQGPRMTSQEQVLEQFGAPSPPQAQNGGWERTLKGRNRNRYLPTSARAQGAYPDNTTSSSQTPALE